MASLLKMTIILLVFLSPPLFFVLNFTFKGYDFQFLLALPLFLIYFGNYLQVGLQCHKPEVVFCLPKSH